MTDVTTVLYCVLQILNHGPQAQRCHAVGPAAQVAYAVQEAAREYPSVPSSVLASLIGHESGFRVNARGALGEIGYVQLLRGGALTGALATLPDKVLYNPRVNVVLGARYLARMQAVCARHDGTGRATSAAKWLSAYNGRGCRAGTPYSDAILAPLRRLRAGAGLRTPSKFLLASSGTKRRHS